MNMHTDRLFYISVFKFRNVDVLLLKHRMVRKVTNAPAKLVHSKDTRYSNPALYLQANVSESAVIPVEERAAYGGLEKMAW